jgi:hypothetical protein
VVVDSQHATISKALGDGAHKTVELSAEARVDYAEDWQQAQAALYQVLGQQLKALWSAWANGPTPSGNGRTANGNPSDATPEHYCQEHGAAIRRFEKEGRTWYSHRTDGGKWCRER